MDATANAHTDAGSPAGDSDPAAHSHDSNGYSNGDGERHQNAHSIKHAYFLCNVYAYTKPITHEHPNAACRASYGDGDGNFHALAYIDAGSHADQHTATAVCADGGAAAVYSRAAYWVGLGNRLWRETLIMDLAGAAGLITALGTLVGAILAGLSLNDRLKKASSRVERLEQDLEKERMDKFDCMKELAEVRGRLAIVTAALERRNLL